jgi:hypothetical protein
VRDDDENSGPEWRDMIQVSTPEQRARDEWAERLELLVTRTLNAMALEGIACAARLHHAEKEVVVLRAALQPFADEYQRAIMVPVEKRRDPRCAITQFKAAFEALR